MNNEPVAWTTEESLKSLSIPFLSQVTLMTALKANKVDDFNIPLYTNPVKELTDEEILEELLIPKSEWNSYKAHHCLKQIRAILRKAQEK